MLFVTKHQAIVFCEDIHYYLYKFFARNQILKDQYCTEFVIHEWCGDFC